MYWDECHASENLITDIHDRDVTYEDGLRTSTIIARRIVYVCVEVQRETAESKVCTPNSRLASHLMHCEKHQ